MWSTTTVIFNIFEIKNIPIKFDIFIFECHGEMSFFDKQLTILQKKIKFYSAI